MGSIRRGKLFRAQNGKCYYCGYQMILTMQKIGEKAPSLMCTEEHLVPLSVGGSDRRENIVAACFSCNNLRGTIRHEAFKWFVTTYGRHTSVDQIMKTVKANRSPDKMSMWAEILRQGYKFSTDQDDQGRTNVIAWTAPYEPNWKERRRALTLARRETKHIVDGFPYYVKNALWLKYLKEEKQNANRAN